MSIYYESKLHQPDKCLISVKICSGQCRCYDWKQIQNVPQKSRTSPKIFHGQSETSLQFQFTQKIDLVNNEPILTADVKPQMKRCYSPLAFTFGDPEEPTA
jgi:hypothetical protein